MEKLNEKISDLGGLIKTIQDKADKNNGVVNSEIKELSEKAESIGKIVNEAQLKADETKKRIEQLEANLVDFSNSDSGQDKLAQKYNEEMAKYLKKGIVVDQGTMQEAASIFAGELKGASSDDREAFKKDLMVQSNPDGGYFVMPDRSDKKVERVFESSPMRALATVMTTSGSEVEMIIDDNEAASGWVGEVQSRPDTDSPQVGLLKIPVHELYAQPKATQKMLDDAGFDITSWLNRKVSSKFERDENTAFVLGDGNLKPKGILTYADWAVAGTYQRDALERITTAGSVVIAADDMIGVQGSLIENYQSNAKWLMQRATFFSDILTLKASGTGEYLFDPQLLLHGGQMQILGKPVRFGADLPDVAANANSVIYGDFSEGYTIVDRLGIRVLRDPYTSKPYIKFYTTKRVGGAVTNYEALKVLKIKA